MFDRQFVLSEEEFREPGWESRKLHDGYILSRHKDLPVHYSPFGGIILIGWAYECDPEKPSPEEQIDTNVVSLLRMRDEEIRCFLTEMEKTWCGRYVLIANHHVCTDATGMLGIFYSRQAVSSSAELLCRIEGFRIPNDPLVSHAVLPDYFPGMHTPYNGIRRLLPSMVLNYRSKSTLFRPLLPDGIIRKQDPASTARYFITRMAESFKNMRSVFRNFDIAVAATGGRDSRTTIAVLDFAGIDYFMYTFGYKSISKGDMCVPGMMAGVTGKPYIYIPRKEEKYSWGRENRYNTHCAGLTDCEDKRFWGYKQYQRLPAKSRRGQVLLLRSGIYEAAVPDYLNPTVLYADAGRNTFLKKVYVHYMHCIKNDHVNTGIDPGTRLYLDLRCGSWLSDIEHGFDMMDNIMSIQVLNCRTMISILLGFDSCARKEKLHQEMITEIACRELAELPYDSDYGSFLTGLRGKLRFVTDSLKTTGLRKTAEWILARGRI